MKYIKRFKKILKKIVLNTTLLKIKQKIVGDKPQKLKRLFCNKSFYVFITMFLTLNILLYAVIYKEQKSLALNQQTFESNIDIINSDPSIILSDAFNAEPNSLTKEYTIYLFLFLGLMLGIESYILLSTKDIRKQHQKRYLLLYFLILQPLVIVPAFIPTHVSNHVVYNLTKLAKIDVTKEVLLLSNSDSLKQLSIASSPIEIKARITQSSEPPKIIDEQVDGQIVIQSLQIQDKDTFYRAVIIPKYLLTQNKLTLNFDAYLFPNNVLVIKNATIEMLSNILPLLSSKIINREIEKTLINKSEPIFEVLTDEAYNLVQERRIEERKIKFINYINEIKSSIADANKYIPKDQADIKSLEQEKIAYTNRADGILKDCESLYPLEDCKQWRTIVSNNIASYDSDLKLVNEDLQTWLYLKPRLTTDLQQAMISYEKFLEFPITPELQAGVFNYPSNIYLKYFAKGDLTPSPTDYIESSLHESLHYYAYKSSNFLPVFIDEGITDHLAYRIIKKYSFNQSVVTGYPQEVSIIQELIRNIPEEELVKAYFSQSEKEFEKLFDKYYMKGTYKKFVSMGDNLTYLDAFDFEGRQQETTEIIQFLVSSKKNEVKNEKI